MPSFLTNSSILIPAKNGENSIFLPIIKEIFKILIDFGECGKVTKEDLGFKNGDRGALVYGSMVLVADEFEKKKHDYREFSKIISYNYDTFNQYDDTENTIKKKVNTFIEKICGKAAIPEFSVNIQPRITNLILISFFGIKLYWRYFNIYKKKINFCNKKVDGFCIPIVPCAARFYKNNYLLVRIAVNNLSWYSARKKEKEGEKKSEGIINYTEPWERNKCENEPFNENFLYVTMVMKASENLKNNNSYEFAILRNDKDPEDLCRVGEELIIDSLSYPIMTNRSVCLTMPIVNTSVKFVINNDDDDDDYVNKEIFSKNMKYFANNINGKNITIDSLVTESKVKINDKGVIVSGSFSDIDIDYLPKIRPYNLTVKVPFVYAISVGKCIIAAGIHNK